MRVVILLPFWTTMGRRELPLVPRTRSSPNIAAGCVANFGFKSGTRIIELLVSFDSEVRLRACCKVVANFGIGTLADRGGTNVQDNSACGRAACVGVVGRACRRGPGPGGPRPGPAYAL